MWRGKIRDINIWKADSSKGKMLSKNQKKEIQGIDEVIVFYKGPQLMEAEIAMLSLSVRSSNCLHRIGYRTIGDIVDAIESWQDLLKVRNLGRTSAVEIICKMKEYQESLLSKAER